MGYAYSNNGASFRAWNEPTNLLPGEVYFSAFATPTELAAAFPAYGTVPLAQQAAAAITAGLTITLSGTLTLGPTVFPTDPATQTKLSAVVLTLVATGAFPGGASSFSMKDSAGTWHTFDAAQYKAVAGAIAAYVAVLTQIVDGDPAAPSALPSSSISLVV